MSTHHGLLIHVVFSTQGRFSIIRDRWRDDLFGYIGGIVRDQKTVLMSAGGTEDHVHLFLKIHPQFALSAIIQKLKANSARWVNENAKVAAKFHWQRGYGAFSVSQSLADSVKRYLANQKEHHRSRSFKDEYLQMLRKH